MRTGTLLRAIFAALLALTMSACVGARPGEAPVPFGAKVTHRAAFIGSSYHDTVGTISLYQSTSRPVIVFEPNFSFDGTKEAVVALGRDGYRSETRLGPLLKPKGRQSYEVPDGIQIDRFNEVWLWYPAGDIPLGLARLTPI